MAFAMALLLTVFIRHIANNQLLRSLAECSHGGTSIKLLKDDFYMTAERSLWLYTKIIFLLNTTYTIFVSCVVWLVSSACTRPYRARASCPSCATAANN